MAQEAIRQFLVTKRFGKLEYVRAFDDDTEALRAYEQEERECALFTRISDSDAECVLLGADRLATLLVTHGNWFDEPSMTFCGRFWDHETRPDCRPVEQRG